MIEPLVSCICVTADRPKYLETAIDCFLAQDYPNKELIVVDDGKEEIAPVLHRRHLSYTLIRSETKLTIGEKRNQACAVSRGEVIAHFDDDDWSAPERLSDQIARMNEFHKDVTGYSSMLFFDECSDEVWKYRGAFDYALGTSLCFTREFWAQHPFIANNWKQHEDNVFVQQARNENQIVCVDAEQIMVARIHASNSDAKKPRNHPRMWQQMGLYELPGEFLNAISKESAIA